MDMKTELITLFDPDLETVQEGSQTAVIALVKNEADIIPFWLGHVCDLFDLVYIVDHQSTDGTREYLLETAKVEKKIHLFSFEHPGYFQSEITNQLAQLILNKVPNCWLFPLDADEFVSVTDRTEFTSLINKQDQGNLLLLNWRNCVPVYLQTDGRVEPGFPCILPSQPGIYNKVAVHGGTYLGKHARFNQGNHLLESESGIEIQINKTPFCNMYHLPIRSIDQFLLKCVQGSVAYNLLPEDRRSTDQGVHWKNMIAIVQNTGVVDANSIRKFVYSYGQPNDLELSTTSIYKFLDMGWKTDMFMVPYKDTVYLRPLQRRYNFLELARQIVEMNPQYLELKNILQIVEAGHEKMVDASLWQKETKFSTKYLKLSDMTENGAIQNSSQEPLDIEILREFFSQAFTPHENPLISSWEGHIPFLYCLINYMRPRRFVELGTLFGNSYFAACQASRKLNNSIECIAVDTWVGDEQTGLYNESVFQHFKYILTRDYPKGKYIRALFSEAVKQFEAGSIDLLHIDGLHTYDAVAEDFRTWFPTLSDRGIVMLHDTHERGGDFGVWKLWAELKSQYPSFEFEHSHGLGVALVGKNPSSRVARFFEIVSKPGNEAFLRFFFSSVGKLSPIKPAS
jgi:hypothetical protein